MGAAKKLLGKLVRPPSGPKKHHAAHRRPIANSDDVQPDLWRDANYPGVYGQGVPDKNTAISLSGFMPGSLLIYL